MSTGEGARLGLAVGVSALVALATPSLGQAAVIPCTPTSPTNDIAIASPPADLQLGHYESDFCMFLFTEQQDVTIGAGGISVDRSPVRGNVAATLPRGSNLSSFIVHSDQIGTAGTTPYSGTYTFEDPVVGLIWTGARLLQSDSKVGIPSPHSPAIIYEPTGTAREMETTGDSVIVSADQHTVTFNQSNSTGADEVRVLTGTVPPQATISGTKFQDTDHDATIDAGEPSLANWTIRAYVDTNADGILQATETTIAASDVTDASGNYSFNLEAGDYVVCEVEKAGWTQSVPSSDSCDAISALEGGYSLNLAGGETLDLDFANYQPTPKPCTPTSPTNDVMVKAPPADLTLGQYESDDCMFLFPEQQDVTIGAGGISVDRSPVRGNTAATLPRGSNLSSFIVQSDKIGNTTAARRYIGTYTFEDPVVGLIWTGARLLQSDSKVGIPPPHSPALTYDASGDVRQMDSPDTVTVQPDQHTVAFDFTTSGAIDSVRVLTGTVPPQATISGTKFNDQDHDATIDAGEPSLANWTIRAYVDTNADGILQATETTIAASDVTDASGNYSFNLEAGDYVVCEVEKAGWTQSVPSSDSCDAISALEGGYSLNLAGGETLDLDFANYQPTPKPCTPTSPTNDVMVKAPPEDLRLGQHESDECIYVFPEQADMEIGAGGISVDRSPVRGGGSPTVLPQDSNLSSFIVHGDKIGNTASGRRYVGSYTFEDPVVGLIYSGSRLNASDEKVGIPDPPHAPGLVYDPTDVNRQKDPEDSVSIDVDGRTVTFDFTVAGYMDEVRVLTGTVPPVVSGAKFHDVNADGDRDLFEPGLEAWTIRAYVDSNGDGTLQAGETTIADETETAPETGTYGFELTPGDYVLCEVSQPEWLQSTPHGGACAAIDGVADGGYAIEVDLSSEITNRNFGNYQRGNPAGVKFHDLNADGDRDPFEPGLEAWTIRAYADANGDGALQATETTIADSDLTAVDGTYQLSLAPGDYVLCEVAQSGWLQSAPANTACAAVTDLAPGGHALTVQSGVAVDEPNFGNYQRGNPAGVKFHDLNADGDRDPFEPGLEAWTIRAYADANGDGALQATETTIADSDLTAVDGTYQLSLAPGDYVLCEVAQSGWLQSAPANTACAAVTDLAPGGHALTVQSGVAVDEPNFGNYQRGNPAGVKFHDLNADGDRDPFEPGLEAWTIRAYADANGDGALQATETTIADSDLTAVDGTYQLSLAPGDYVLCEVAQSGWLQSAPANTACAAVTDLAPGGHALTVQSGVAVDEPNFGNYQRGNPAGVKFHDLNADGDRDPFEPGLEAWTIRAYADANGDGALQATETTIADSDLTAVDGTYQLSLAPGDYVLCEVAQSGWLQSAPANTACAAVTDLAPGGHALTVQSGVAVDEPNFGNYQRASVSGLKFLDANGDGDRDSGEGPLAGWTINAYTDEGNGDLSVAEFAAGAAASATTAANGTYSIALNPGAYVICEQLQTGWEQTAPAAAPAECDAAASLGPQGHAVALASGQSYNQADFGNRQTVTDRDGSFSCRGRALGPGTNTAANNPFSPCVDAVRANALSQTLGNISVTVFLPVARTDQTPNVLDLVPPAVGDSGYAEASVVEVRIKIGVQVLTLKGITAEASATCASTGPSARPTLDADSDVATLRQNSGPLRKILGAPLNLAIPLVGVLHLNHESVSGGVITRRAVWLELPGQGITNDIVAGEAMAGYSGNPCSA